MEYGTSFSPWAMFKYRYWCVLRLLFILSDETISALPSIDRLARNLFMLVELISCGFALFSPTPVLCSALFLPRDALRAISFLWFPVKYQAHSRQFLRLGSAVWGDFPATMHSVKNKGITPDAGSTYDKTWVIDYESSYSELINLRFQKHFLF